MLEPVSINATQAVKICASGFNAKDPTIPEAINVSNNKKMGVINKIK